MVISLSSLYLAVDSLQFLGVVLSLNQGAPFSAHSSWQTAKSTGDPQVTLWPFMGHPHLQHLTPQTLVATVSLALFFIPVLQSLKHHEVEGWGDSKNDQNASVPTFCQPSSANCCFDLSRCALQPCRAGAEARTIYTLVWPVKNTPMSSAPT